MARLFSLSDEAWALLDPHLPRGRPASRGSMTGASSAASCMF